MDSKFIQEAVQKWLFECDHVHQACNFSRCGYTESDVLAVTRSMIVTEIEVKISKSDFMPDFKKTHKHYKMQNCQEDEHQKVPNRFYYAVPKTLAALHERCPKYAGFMTVDENGVVEVLSGAPMLHRRKAEPKMLIAMLENLTAKTIFGCQYMTYKNRISNEMWEKAEMQRKETQKQFLDKWKV